MTALGYCSEEYSNTTGVQEETDVEGAAVVVVLVEACCTLRRDAVNERSGEGHGDGVTTNGARGLSGNNEYLSKREFILCTNFD